jgi:hypothetical protein
MQTDPARIVFPVIGFVKDPTGVAALYLGKREGKELVSWVGVLFF